MNIKSFADLDDIIIQGDGTEPADKTDDSDYEYDIFEDDNSPLKSAMRSMHVSEDDLPGYDSEEFRRYDSSILQHDSEPAEEGGAEGAGSPTPAAPPAEDDSFHSLSTDQEFLNAKENLVTSNQQLHRNDAASHHYTRKSAGKSQYPANIIRSAHSVGKKQSKSPHLSRVSFVSMPAKFEQDASSPIKVTDIYRGDTAKGDIESVVRKVLEEMTHRQDREGKKLAKRAVNIPSIRLKNPLIDRESRQKSEASLNVKSQESDDSPDNNLEDVIPFFDPDYDQALILHEDMLDHRMMAKKSLQSVKPIRSTLNQFVVESSLDAARPKQTNLTGHQINRSKADTNCAFVAQPLKKENRSVFVQTNGVDESAKAFSQSEAVARPYNALKWTDSNMLDMKIMAEGIYSSFLKDIIETCRARASECTSLEEMAMHRALAEHMLQLHGSKKEVERVQRDMIRATRPATS